MSNDHYARVRDAFLHIRELDGPSRAEALVELKHTDASVHDQVLALLAADTPSENANSLEQAIEEGLIRGAIGLARAESLAPGDRIGPYTIEALLGEGGFGAVYRAQQHEPVKRVVAIKVLKAGMDTKQVVARFEQERQALALMDHANIARVFDAGATPSGRPYVAMEYWPGEPIDQFCADHNLDLRARLDLMLQVCAAVQHAHMKGVIHRDLKPGNVLVALQDGRPQAKVIDFGIAKAIDAPLTDLTLHTEHRQFMGTPHYMSPEQAEGSADIDTRTDVYALGVLLYQLLTGQTPFTSRQVQSAGLEELRRLIREVDPPRPSTRLGQSTQESRTARSKRLETRIRGELDWITMKALEKDRRRRYASPSALSEDLERYLKGDAVVAAPPSRLYRVRKFTRRNRGVVTSTGAVMAALLLGAIAFAWQAHVAQQQRDDAILARSNEALAREQADRVADFQATLLSNLDPDMMGIRMRRLMSEQHSAMLDAQGLQIAEAQSITESFHNQLSSINFTDLTRTAIDEHVLRPALDAIDTRFADDRRAQARLLQALATTLRNVGLLDASRDPQQRALALLDPQDDLDLRIGSHSEAGILERSIGNYQAARTHFEATIELSTLLHGPEHEHTLAAIHNLALILIDHGKLDEAGERLAALLQTQMRALPPEHRDIYITLNTLGILSDKLGDHTAAYDYYLRAHEGLRAIQGDRGKDAATAFAGYAGSVFLTQGAQAAEQVMREATRLYIEIYGSEHPDSITARVNLGFVLFMAGNQEEGMAELDGALAQAASALGAFHPTTSMTHSNLGLFHYNTAHYALSISHLLQALQGREYTLGPEHPDTISVLRSLGTANRRRAEDHTEEIATRRQSLAEALRYWRLAWQRSGPNRIPDDSTMLLAFNLGLLLMNTGSYEEAEAVAKEFYRLAGLRPDHPASAVESSDLLSRLYTAWHAAEPDAGYDARAAAWNAKLQEAKAAAGG